MKYSWLGTALKGSLVVIIIAALFASTPKSTFATGIPVLDAANLSESIINYVENAVTAAQQYASTYQQYYEWAQSFDLANLKGTLTQSLQDKIMNYVNTGGAGGGPAYVTDWRQYTDAARSQGSRNAIDTISRTDVCDDFRTPLLSALGAPSQPTPTLQNGLSCDFPSGKLTQIAADPSQGSWADYQNSFKAQNNFYGSYLMAKNAVEGEAAKSAQAATNEALSGGGFLSTRNSEGLITTPGSVIEGLATKAAGSDFDLVANADQLKDIMGMVSGGLVSELTSGNKGIAGVNLAARRARRNQTRNQNGKLIASEDRIPNCNQIFADSLTAAQFAQVDTNNDGVLSVNEISAALTGAPAGFDYSLYDLCQAESGAQTGNTTKTTDATVSEILAKRRKAQDKFKDLIVTTNATINRLEGYPSAKKKSLYKIDNPNYNPNYQSGDNIITKYKYAFVGPNVNIRKCYDITSYEFINKTGTKNDYVRANFQYIDYVSDPAKTFDPATDVFIPGTTATTNPGPNGKTVRCTVNLTNSNGKLIEVAYYELQTKAMKDVSRANDLALDKVTALQQIMKQASKTGPVILRNEKVAELVNDFRCHGNPFQCIIIDPNNPSLRKQLGCDNDDADATIPDSGYYLPDNFCNKSSTWVPVPDHSTISSTEMASRQAYGYDTYGDVLRKVGLVSAAAIDAASKTAFNGLISNITFNPGFAEDDPSNPYYDPAFDPEEASRVFLYSQGNFDILGNLQAPDDAADDTSDGDNPDVDNGAPAEAAL